MLNELSKETKYKYVDYYERTIITMILGDTHNNRNKIIEELEPEMFSSSLYRNFFKEIKKVYESGDEVNIFTVCKNIKIQDQRQLLFELDKMYITNINWRFYVKEIQQEYLQRRIEAAKSASELKELNTLIQRFNKAPILSHISENAENLTMEYFETMEHSVFTGLVDVDAFLGSFQKGDMVVLAGATSSGKTMFMLNLALNIAKIQNKKVDIYSLEMKRQQLINRLVCSEISINASGFRKHNWSKSELEKYADYLSNSLPKLPININNVGKIELNELITSIRKSDADVIFIDYLGLIRNKSCRDRYERISEISMEIKAAALDANKIIIALHQLSRANASREDKTPRLSDLRDSGQIEQDADTVMFIYRPAYYFDDQPKDLMQAIIAKNRGGELGIADLCCNLNTQKISNRIKVF